MRFHKGLGVLALISAARAQTQSDCVSDGVCYAVNIPEASASSDSGDIYFQISGPSTMSWIGLGQGSQMAGANIFIIYANSAGTNVTLSPRSGTGHQPPVYPSTANVTLLEGSGIVNGTMIANVRCSNCNSWSGGTMSFTNANSDWIYATHSGTPISSDDPAAVITFHTAYGTTNFNLQQATGGNTSNPFDSTVVATTTPSVGSGPAGGSRPRFKIPSNFRTILKAHGILGGLTFVILMPLGAMAMRLLTVRGLVYLHAGWMLLAYSMALAVLGMGVWIAVTVKKLDSYHAIIGIVVIGALFLQPFTGLTHHILFKRGKGRSYVATYPHIWWGRIIVTLAIINGGLGLLLAWDTPSKSRGGAIAYGVVAGIIWVAWMTVIAITEGKKVKQNQQVIAEDVARSGSDEKIRHSESARGPA